MKTVVAEFQEFFSHNENQVLFSVLDNTRKVSWVKGMSVT